MDILLWGNNAKLAISGSLVLGYNKLHGAIFKTAALKCAETFITPVWGIIKASFFSLF